MDQQNITLKAKGLFTFPNVLSDVPDGALSVASNVVIDRDGVVNPRRGIKLYGNTFGSGSSRAKQLLIYKDRLLRHWTTELDVDSDGSGTFTAMKDVNGGNVSVSEVSTGTRIKFNEANGNLYFTTSKGIYKISCLHVADIATRPVTLAGGIKALDSVAVLNSQTGWFTEDSVVAYRVVWGITDENTNVILGVPSERVIIYNPLLSLLIGNYNQMVTDLADVSAVPTFTLAGDEHTTTTIDNISSTANLSVGMTVTGSNIPANTTIATIVGPNSITISNAATATAAGVTLTYGQKLSDTDYASLKISLNSSSVTLYNALKALAYGGSNKLDNDIGGTTFQSITLTPATAPSNPATTAELVAMQTYFDNIINALNTTTGISTYAKNTAIGGAFSNSSQSATVDLTFTIPSDITTAYYYQVYRSALFTSSGVGLLSDLTPDDELRLIYENNPTGAEISAKSVTFHDDVPESFRDGGANLYTNSNSGEGIAQANTPPPLALDLALFKGSTFYANTSSLYNKELGLLTATGLNGGKLYITQSTTVNTYTFVNSVAQITTINMVSGANLVSVGTSDYFDIYSANSATHYRVWFQVGTSVAPSAGGATLVQCSVLGGDTSTQAAVKLSNTLTSIVDFTASNLTNVVTVKNENTGYTTAPSEHVANAGFTIVVATTGTGEDAANKKIGISNASTPAQEVDETARSIVRVVNKNASEVINAFYTSGPDDLPGLMRFEARQLGDPTFYITASSNAIAAKFNPDLKTYTSITNISVANPTVVSSVAHGLVTGDTVIITGSDSTPVIDGYRTITKIDADTFTVPVNVTVGGSAGRWIKSSVAIVADNEVVPNRIYYSKLQQPEAVPLVNFQDVGPKNKAILRILPLRDNLFILKEEGVYRLSGDNVNNFSIALFDSSTQLKAVDSAVVLNNQIYMFSSQGIATISETGISIISRPIENKLLPLVTSLYPHFTTATFATAYESDRSYLLFTVTNPSDTVATVGYRYNTFTNTWVSWDVTKTCGIVNPSPDNLYFGAGDTNSIELERKSFTRLDYADRQYTHTVPNSAVSGTSLSLGSLFEATVGDVFVQTQYLTIAQLNRHLRYMDTDQGLNNKNYYSLLGVSAGAQLRDTLTTLATKIDNDPGIATPGYAAAIAAYTSSFVDTQLAFNVIVTRLNADANTKHKGYTSSTGTVDYEVAVSAINSTTHVITMSYAAPLVAGDIVLYKKIMSSITWVPHHFGDASMLKQVSESTILFENTAFTNATASYSSDLSPGFESIAFTGDGTGTWGGTEWGSDNWGGEGTSSPFRTYIPVNKQRCRYINGQFEHESAFEDYAIFGISFTFRAISARAYR